MTISADISLHHRAVLVGRLPLREHGAVVEGEPRGMFAGTDIDRRAGKCGRHDQGELPNDHPKAP